MLTLISAVLEILQIIYRKIYLSFRERKEAHQAHYNSPSGIKDK